jgi:hypothetical protein
MNHEIDAEIAELTYRMLSASEWEVETPAEGALMKLFELRVTPIVPAKCVRNPDFDYALCKEDGWCIPSASKDGA